MIDTHCHLDVERFDGDRMEVLERGWRAGVRGIVIPAIGPDAWDALLEWPSRDPRVQIGLGIHPQVLPELDARHDDAHLQRLDELLSRGVAIAVGECGFDRFKEDHVSLDRQAALLKAHFALARKYRLPLLVHVLRAHDAFQKFLRDEEPVEAGILMHSYSGSADLVRWYLKYNCHFSLAGPVTFEGARRAIESVKAIPLDRLHAETDAPDQAPHPFRGQRSEPALLIHTVDALARIKGLAQSELITQLQANARALFPSWRVTVQQPL